MFKSHEVGFVVKEGYDLGNNDPNDDEEAEPDPTEDHCINSHDLDPEEKKNKI